MEKAMSQLAKLFHNKITLYEELIHILELEKESLAQSDVEALWNYAEKKHNVITKITEIRMEILTLLCELGISHDMNTTTFTLPRLITMVPDDFKGVLRDYNVPLRAVKDRVNHMARENKRFVEEYLEVLDDLIGIIADAGASGQTYGTDSQSLSRKQANLFIHQEV